MILVGNQRGGAQDLARHLMKDENERVTVHEIRGFVARDLAGALQESYAISQGTKCKRHLYSLSLNPPTEADATEELFEEAIERAEERLGLTGQPRAIVFHEKIGADGALRRHAHAVWCRIDTGNMRAVQMSHDWHKLNDLARDLYREHGWTMPRGFVRHEERDPRNYTLAEWQQAKRAGKDPAKTKALFQDLWAISDSRSSFSAALRENGYVLARGDKRGAVAVDHTGEAFPVGRAVGVKAKELRARLGDLDALPSREEAHRMAAKMVTDRLKELKAEQSQSLRKRLEGFEAERRRRLAEHHRRMENQRTALRARQGKEQAARQARFRKGWRGLIDKITGKKRRIEAENREAERTAAIRDAKARDDLAARQRATETALKTRRVETKLASRATLRELAADIRRLEPREQEQPKTPLREAAEKRHARTPTAERKKRRASSRSRDGPSLSR